MPATIEFRFLIRAENFWNCGASQAAHRGYLCYPYDLALDGQGHIYVCEYGNHRVQKFTLDGKSLACWGSQGRAPGEMHNPWGLVRDSLGGIYVLDTIQSSGTKDTPLTPKP